MSFTVEKLSDMPVIVASLHSDYDLLKDVNYSNAAIAEILNATSDSLSLIINFELKLSIDEIMRGASSVTREEGAIFLHPNVKQIYFITDDPALKLSAKGMSSEAFGGLNIMLFRTVEEALDYINSN
jgi:hypothetical protein